MLSSSLVYRFTELKQHSVYFVHKFDAFTKTGQPRLGPVSRFPEPRDPKYP